MHAHIIHMHTKASHVKLHAILTQVIALTCLPSVRAKLISIFCLRSYVAHHYHACEQSKENIDSASNEEISYFTGHF